MTVPLNTLRAFALVARLGGVSAAADALSVSPGAVSHQIRRLEEAVGIALFDRTPNGLRLTEAGRRLAERLLPALTEIDHALADLARDGDELVIRAPLTLALRWLIPALERLRRVHPSLRVRVETTHLDRFPLEHGIDVAILRLGPAEEKPDGRGTALVLAEDLRRPLAAPPHRTTPLQDIPALTSQPGDWAFWCKAAGTCSSSLRMGNAFDTEDAALSAASAGLGTVLSSGLISAHTLGRRHIVPLPGLPTVRFGTYWLLIHPAARVQVRRVCRWAVEDAEAVARMAVEAEDTELRPTSEGS